MSAVVSSPREQARTLRLLAVHAHPDDETLSTGALLATWTAAGHHACVVTCTRGEQGEVIPSELAHLEGSGKVLADVRTAELHGALGSLGVSEHHFLDSLPGGRELVDSGMRWIAPGIAGPAEGAGLRAFSTVPLTESAMRLADFMREFAPDVVVTYEPGGGYGHPDHIQASAVTREAVRLSGTNATLVHAIIPLQTAATTQAALRSSNEVDELLAQHPELALDVLYDGALDPSRLPPAVTEYPGVSVKVDVARVGESVRQAMRSYATQIKAVTQLHKVAGVIGCAALSNNVVFPISTSEFHQVIKTGELLSEINKIPGISLVEGSTGSNQRQG